MTEEIIIDGVDVCGCKNFSCGICEEENKIPRTINHFAADCKLYPNCYYKQLKRLQETLKHTESGRKTKANKLKRIEEIVTHCIQGGFTDEFIQEIFDICREYEEV